MAFFGLFGASAGTSGDESGFGDALYTNNELLGAYKDLSYVECRDIYRYWSLGKRIATSLPNFAMSAEREFTCGEHPQEIIDEFKKVATELDIDNIIKKTAIYARVYGLASLFVACNGEGVKLTDALSYEKIQNNDIVFNSLDPLAMGGGVQVEMSPLSTNFQKVKNASVGGQQVHTKRLCTIYNDIPLHLKFNPSSYSFSGSSVYQNMTLLIRSWNRCIVALQRLATKGGALVKTSKAVPTATGINVSAVEKNLDLIRKMENDGIASIQIGEELNGFQLTGASEVDTIIQQMNSALMMALSDTPSSILLDKNLAQGFGEGSEDMKAILMAVDSFRLSILRPLYSFADKFIKYKAWSPEFILKIKQENPDLYGDMSVTMIMQQWLQDFKAEFGNIYPETKKDEIEYVSTQLDILNKIKDLGSDEESIGEALSQINAFDGIDFIIKTQGEDLDNEETDSEGFDECVKKIRPDNQMRFNI